MAIPDPNGPGRGARVTGIFDRLRTGVGASPGRGTDTPTPGPKGRARGAGGIEGGPLAWSVPAAGLVVVVLILALSLV